MIELLGAGSLVGLGAFLAARALFPPRPSLAVVLQRVYGSNSALGVTVGIHGRAPSRVARSLVNAMEALGIRQNPLRADLAVIGRSIEDHTAIRLGSALALALSGVALHITLSAIGFGLPFAISAGVAIGAAATAIAAVDAAVRQAAARRRQEFRQGLAFFLDLMIVVLSGGGGPSTAVRLASQAGEGWVYEQLRQALAAGRIRRQEPWDTLAALGAEFEVVELEELAAAVSMAERQGASVRQSLAAKAGSIRDRRASEIEARAKAATVRMALPLVLLGLGFASLLLFGAVMSLVSAVNT